MPEGLFPLVERELARQGGGEAEVYVVRSRVRRYEARQGAIDAIAFSEGESVGVRAFRNGRMGFSYAFRSDAETLARAVEIAVYCSDAADPDPAYGLPDDPSPFPELPLYRAAAERLADARRAEFAAGLEASARAFDPRVRRVRTAALVETLSETRFRNSRGRAGTQRQSGYLAWVEAVAEDGGEGQTGYGLAFGRSLDEIDGAAVAAEAADRAVRMLGARGLPSGRYPAVLENRAAAELLEVLVPSFLASNVAKGRSMLAGKEGTLVASRHVTIVDDPCDPAGDAACAFDGEGTASRRNVLVAGGTLRGFLADSYWGRKAGTGTTGSCRRPGPKVPPAVGPSNVRIAAGQSPPSALCRELGRGILVTEFLGIHTADPVSGDFAVGACGFLFEGGEVKRPVRGIAVSGNVLGMLSSVVGVGSDFRWFGSVGAPSLAVESLSVGGE